MERKEFLISSAVGTVALGTGELSLPDVGQRREPHNAARKILIAGGGFGPAFIRYMASLTGKERPRLCYLPTAAAAVRP